MNNYVVVYSDSLYHHGILGQKWGVRRYQNEDGTLTDAGKRRYNTTADGSTLVKKTAAERKAYAKQEHYDKAPDHVKKAIDYRNAESKGKRFVKDWLIGPSARVTYDMARSYGEGRVKSYLRSHFDMNVSDLLGAVAAGATAGAVNTATKSKNYQLAGVAGNVAGVATTYATRDKGLSLQQRSLGKRYEYGDPKKAAKYDAKIEALKSKKDYDVKSFDAITEDLAYPKSGKVFYSVEDAKRDQRATAEAYDKKIAKLENQRNKYVRNR